MRTFHITWATFFVCFFAWFGIAPLMPIIREDLALTPSQVGNCVVGSIAITVFARLFFGWLCDRIGPRLTYVILLATGAIPVMTIGLSESYESFLLLRMAIGLTGASFVITQYHTSAMFAPGIVGTANAMAAGWGNMGGGVTLIVMPLVFASIMSFGFPSSDAWRLAMILPGMAMLVMAFLYYFLTRDTPEGNRPAKRADTSSKGQGFLAVSRDVRVWVLFVGYAACFGIEITMDNIAILYFVDTFHVGLGEAGLIAGSFGLMNLFARALGGFSGDLAGRKFGLNGRMVVLAVLLGLEGLGIALFSQMQSLGWAIATMLLFALFLKMANGATYAAVPFVNTRSVGMVSGIVGSGGNVGAVLAGLLFTSDLNAYRDNFLVMGLAVVSTAVFALSTILWKTRASLQGPSFSTSDPELLPGYERK